MFSPGFDRYEVEGEGFEFKVVDKLMNREVVLEPGPNVGLADEQFVAELCCEALNSFQDAGDLKEAVKATEKKKALESRVLQLEQQLKQFGHQPVS